MSPTFITKRGDTRTAIKATLKDATGQPVDLTGCQVKFIMSKQNGGAKINRDALVQDAANGVVWFVFEANEVDEIGTFKGEFEVTYGDGRVETFPNDGYIIVQINPDLG